MDQNLHTSKCCWTTRPNLKPSRGPACSITFNMLAISVLCAIAIAARASSPERSEIVFTDSRAAVLRANATTGNNGVITRENKLVQPFGIAVGQGGELFVSDTGCLGLLRIDPAKQTQTMLACGGGLGVPFGIALERNGMILVANAQALLRVHPHTGASSVVSAPGLGQCLFQYPLAVAVAENRDIFVADALGPIFRVDPDTGAQTLI